MNKKIILLIISAFILLSFTPVSNAQKPEFISIKISPQEQWQGQPVNITVTIASDSEIILAKINIQCENTTPYYNAVMDKISDNTFYWNATYEKAGNYKFFIWAKNKNNSENTSALYTFTIINNHPPNTPSNPFPMDDASNVNINVTMAWSCSDEDAEDILTYDIYFGTNSNPPKVKTNHTTTSYKPGTLQYDTDYYWRIVAKDGKTSTSSPVWHFKTKPYINHKPNTPSKPSGPNSGYTNTSYSFSTSATDPDNDNLKYQFDWGDGNKTDTAEYYSSGVKATASHVWNKPGIYEIKVRASDGEKWSDWSQSKTITITEKPPQPENNPPDTPEKPSGPITGETNTSYSYSTKTIDPDNNQVYYLFDWGDGTNTGWKGPYNSNITISVSHSWNKPGTYEIKVKAKDTNNAESPWSPALTVNIYQQAVNNPPNKPTISGPTTGYTNHAYNYTISTTDPDNDNIKYIIDWGDQTLQQTTFENSGSIITVSHTWTKKGVYLVRVKAIDANNAESEWSDTLSMTIQGSTKFQDSDNDGLPDTIDLQPNIPQNTRKITIGNKEFYLVDSNNDGTYDQLYNNQTQVLNYLGKEDDYYLLDTDNDGNWDYTYDLTTNTVKKYEKAKEQIPWMLILLGLCIIAILIILAVLLTRRKKTATPIVVENITKATVACPSCRRIIEIQGKPGTTVPVKCPSCGKKA